MTISDSFFSSVLIPAGWRSLLKEELSREYMLNLQTFLAEETARGATVFPDRENIFRAFAVTDYSKVRVVVLGQDPYHDVGQANGLSFAVKNGLKIPPSLRNIFKEIKNDLGCALPAASSLEGWAEQGVLLLNTVLTVRAHEAFSHRGRGWETFTEQVLKALNDRSDPVVFMLWGAPAQDKAKLITHPHHLILRAPHPSPLSAHRGFFGCRHFSLANEFLEKCGRGSINWLATDTLTVSNP